MTYLQMHEILYNEISHTLSKTCYYTLRVQVQATRLGLAIPLTFCSAFLRKNPPDRFGIFDEFEKVEKLN